MKELCVDQSDWARIRITGGDRVRFLHGMCTANIETLGPGQWRRACMLNVKGRVMSVFDVVAEQDALLVLCEPQVAEQTFEILDRHAIADDVEFDRESGPLHRIWGEPEAVWEAPPVLAPPPGPVASAEEVEVRRIEAGLPRYGVDVSADNFPFETPLVRLVDYEKGCFIGQEPVARVKARGSAQKTLRGLRVEGEGAVTAGAEVAAAARDRAGQVTSAAVSSELGSIALAYIHRAAWEPGTRVTVEGRAAVVEALPFCLSA